MFFFIFLFLYLLLDINTSPRCKSSPCYSTASLYSGHDSYTLFYTKHTISGTSPKNAPFLFPTVLPFFPERKKERKEGCVVPRVGHSIHLSEFFTSVNAARLICPTFSGFCAHQLQDQFDKVALCWCSSLKPVRRLISGQRIECSKHIQSHQLSCTVSSHTHHRYTHHYYIYRFFLSSAI